MNRQSVNRICAAVPLILSLVACVWVLGNVAGGAKTGGDEGLGFKVFWLLILAQMPFIVGYLVTADWKRQGSVAARLVLQGAALVLAFSPVAYFRL
ncbi:MAG: hypothetical protein J0G99_04715 [Alphaproteobacteria bacterium]|nr:hypothetical protein [Alphaproteobacteria bacterium]